MVENTWHCCVQWINSYGKSCNGHIKTLYILLHIVCRLLECTVKDEHNVQFGLTHDISASHAVPLKVHM